MLSVLWIAATREYAGIHDVPSDNQNGNRLKMTIIPKNHYFWHDVHPDSFLPMDGGEGMYRNKIVVWYWQAKGLSRKESNSQQRYEKYISRY